MGYDLNLDNPITYNEKLQWLKIHDRRPEYTIMVDKYAVKKYVSDRIGTQYVIPTLGVYKTFDDIDFDMLPDSFVLKCTHDSAGGAGHIFVKDKTDFDRSSARKIFEKRLQRNMFYRFREWPYKNVQPRIIAEKYMDDGTGKPLIDYKVLCFMGEPKLIEVHQNRFTDLHTQDFYDTAWRKTNIKQLNSPDSDIDVPRPRTLDKMLEFSKMLSQNMYHVRVDWYEINGGLYFGEFTFFDSAGLVPFTHYEDDKMLGDWIEIRR